MRHDIWPYGSPYAFRHCLTSCAQLKAISRGASVPAILEKGLGPVKAYGAEVRRPNGVDIIIAANWPKERR